MSLDLWNRDQWEIHVLQGVTYTTISDALAYPLLHNYAYLVGIAVTAAMTAYWEIPQIRDKASRNESYADDIKDIVQRMLGSAAATGCFFLLTKLH